VSPASLWHLLGNSTVTRLLAGGALDPSVRQAMEAAFGHDFASVRVRHDAHAAQQAKSLDAHAFTRDNLIILSEPPTLELLAHELAHVVQQRRGGGAPGRAHEAEADAAGRAAATGERAQVTRGSLHGAIQCNGPVIAGPTPPAWLNGVKATHVQGNIWEVQFKTGGPHYVGPYTELRTFVDNLGMKADVHHIVGGEHLTDLGSSFSYENAPCVAIDPGLHERVVSPRITGQQREVGGRATKRWARPNVSVTDVKIIYEETYTKQAPFPELGKIAGNILDQSVPTPPSVAPKLPTTSAPPAAVTGAGTSTTPPQTAAATPSTTIAPPAEQPAAVTGAGTSTTPPQTVADTPSTTIAPPAEQPAAVTGAGTSTSVGEPKVGGQKSAVSAVQHEGLGPEQKIVTKTAVTEAEAEKPTLKGFGLESGPSQVKLAVAGIGIQVAGSLLQGWMHDAILESVRNTPKPTIDAAQLWSDPASRERYVPVELLAANLPQMREALELRLARSAFELISFWRRLDHAPPEQRLAMLDALEDTVYRDQADVLRAQSNVSRALELEPQILESVRAAADLQRLVENPKLIAVGVSFVGFDLQELSAIASNLAWFQASFTRGVLVPLHGLSAALARAETSIDGVLAQIRELRSRAILRAPRLQ
jgi:hypothetical protein